MLKWLFGNRGGSTSDRIEAVEAYLERFEPHELDYMGDLELIDIYMCLDQGQDPYRSVDLVSFIRTIGMAKAGGVQDTPFARSVVRGKVRMKLANATRKLMRNPTFSNSMVLLGAFRTGVEPESAEQVDRLGDHVTMLERIYRDPLNAPLLPSLAEIGEAEDWERYWRKTVSV
jgi:hypothetical protein